MLDEFTLVIFYIANVFFCLYQVDVYEKREKLMHNFSAVPVHPYKRKMMFLSIFLNYLLTCNFLSSLLMVYQHG